MIIAIDPGSVRTGVAMFQYDPVRRKANLVVKKIVTGKEEIDDVISILSNLSSNRGHIIVLEAFRHAHATGNFRNRKSTKMSEDEAKTHKLAKMIEGIAAMRGIRCVLQEPRILAIGRKWCDFPVSQNPKVHIPDDISAYIHGAKFMMDEGMILSVDDIAKFGQESLSESSTDEKDGESD